MCSGIYLKSNGTVIEFYKESGAFNITEGKVEPTSILKECELIEEIKEAA